MPLVPAPLIFLLLRRIFSIVARAGDTTLHATQELHIVRNSMHTLRRAVSNRIRTLQATRDPSLRSLSLNRYISLAVYKLRNLNEREQLEKFFGGLVRDFTQSGAKHEGS